MAGGQEGIEGSASVAAVKFSSNIKLITEYGVKEAGEMVYSLKRHENGNILFAGARSKVIILFFDGIKFESIAQYSNLPLTSITHLQSLDEELYCVSPEESIMLKLIYASRGVVIENKEKPKVERSTILQFGVSTKKACVLGSKATWMKLDAAKQNMMFKTMGKLNLVAKEDGKVFKFNSEMKDQGVVFQDLQKLLDGRWVYTLPHSNTLKLTGKDMDEITEIIARDTQSYHPLISAIVSVKTTDPHIFLWPMGAGYLGIMDLQRMEYDRVPGLGGLSGDSSIAHLMLAAQNGSKILSISHKESDNSLFVSFWQKIEAGKRITRSAEYLYPKRSF